VQEEPAKQFSFAEQHEDIEMPLAGAESDSSHDSQEQYEPTVPFNGSSVNGDYASCDEQVLSKQTTVCVGTDPVLMVDSSCQWSKPSTPVLRPEVVEEPPQQSFVEPKPEPQYQQPVSPPPTKFVLKTQPAEVVSPTPKTQESSDQVQPKLEVKDVFPVHKFNQLMAQSNRRKVTFDDLEILSSDAKE
jgi:hypothetical protein